MTPGHIPMGDGAEFDLIRTMLGVWKDAAQEIGDDAAILDPPFGEKLCISTDTFIEGVHFRHEWMTPAEIGGKAAAAALSDLAAMAARPMGLLLALSAPSSWRAHFPDLARGLAGVAARMGCPIIGGNTSRAERLSLTCTVVGTAVAPLRRSGARAGDALYVTGTLGSQAVALAALETGHSLTPTQRQRFVAPMPRIEEALWLAERGATAAVDISDGLLADARHLASASGTSIDIVSRLIPLAEGAGLEDALASGEEYELILAFPADAPPDCAAFRELFSLGLTFIGTVHAREEALVAIDGDPNLNRSGFTHFR